MPDVWLPSEDIRALRQQVAQRARLVQQQTRLKNRVHAILQRNLVLGCPRSDLFGKGGQEWLAKQAVPLLPAHEQQTVEATLRELTLIAEELHATERPLAGVALQRRDVRHLLTIPGVDAAVALALVAAIGDVRRFSSPTKLVGYLGLDPRVRQSGARPASYGPITKQGRAHARGALAEAAWVAVKTPGPLRACYQRIRARRGSHIAVIAVARKLAVLAWHLLTKDEDYAFARPSLTTNKLRKLELRAGHPAHRGRRGATYAYNFKETRRREQELGLQAERAYQHLTAQWQLRPQRTDASAPMGKRR